MFKWFKTDTNELTTRIGVLRIEKQALKVQLSDLKQEAKIADEDIKHMVKMREERLEIEFEKKNLERQQEKEAEIADVKDIYRDKLEVRLENEVVSIKEMYSEILQRLPTVSVRQVDRIMEKRS